jgi:hypothetical protein
MIKSQRRVFAPIALAAGVSLSALALATPSHAEDTIKIGVIAEAQAVAGSSIPQAAQLAADEINAAGGVNGKKIEIFTYDDHSKAPEAVLAFQRAVNQDHVNAVIASYISEVVLALEPWTGRLKTVRRHHPEYRQGLRQSQIYVPRLFDVDQYCRRDLRRREGPSGRTASHEVGRRDERGRRLDHAA